MRIQGIDAESSFSIFDYLDCPGSGYFPPELAKKPAPRPEHTLAMPHITIDCVSMPKVTASNANPVPIQAIRVLLGFGVWKVLKGLRD